MWEDDLRKANGAMRHFLAMLLLVASQRPIAAESREAPMRFTVTNPADVPRETVVRVSVPLPPGAIDEAPGVVSVTSKNRVVPAQAHVITRHPGGSVRRVMLSLPVKLAAGEAAEFTFDGTAPADAPASMLRGREPARITTDRFAVTFADGAVRVLGKEDTVLATVQPFGPRPNGDANVTVLEAGPYFVWLRYREDGREWSREIDVEVDRFGAVALTHRVQVHLDGDHWTLDFGFELKAQGADGPAGEPVHFMQYDTSARFADHLELVPEAKFADGSSVSLANPLAFRQNRGTLEIERVNGCLLLRSNRNEPVKNLEREGLMTQEGAWRFTRLVIAPVGPQALAAHLDAPVYGHADWRLYDAVYHTGPPLEVKHPVLRDCVEKMVYALQDMQMKGDDLGSMPWSWSPQRTRPDYTSAVRLNHSLYVWEDWFRGGDPRLRRVAHDWLRNYHDVGMYWGPDPKYYGAGRRGNLWRDRPGHGPGTFNPRFDNSPIYVHKGWSSFYLMYEETGAPRYRAAATAAAEWSISNQHAGRNYTRTIGVVADAIKMFEYTGDGKHLANALHLWKTFQEIQGEDLLFTESGRPAVGNDLYIGKDSLGYKHPFVKPYIVQYATNALPYLLAHTPRDRRLRNTIIALNDFMVRVQQPGGGWGYPHPAAAGLSWSVEYVHGIMLAYERVEAKESYLAAVAQNLRPMVQLAARYGWPATGLNPWEFAAKINLHERQRRYKLATDRPALRDYDEGQVRFGRSPDRTVYFQVLLRDYLSHRSEDSLFESTPLVENMKRLRTTLDPKVAAPARVVMGGEQTAAISLTVDSKSPFPQLASARVADLPDGVSTAPSSVEWLATRGRTQSPSIHLRGAVTAETPVTINWRIGEGWTGAARVILVPGTGGQ